MMAQCLKDSLSSAAMERLKPYQSQYTTNNTECTQLLYKIIMKLATIESAATPETL
jgi:hypothetical protein